MSAAFVFLHVGPDAEVPALLVRSLRRHHPDAQIIQCSDAATPPVAGVDSVEPCEGDTANLMTLRLSGFAALDLRVPAFYLDTDMLCVAPLDAAMALDGCEVAVCRREYACDAPINARFKGLELPEYVGRMLGEVYPYVACATAAASGAFWAACLDNLRGLDRKFHLWYGDQEAIRNVVAQGRFRVGFLPESIYGCLPDAQLPPGVSPRLLHFKGLTRKPMMFEVARRLALA